MSTPTLSPEAWVLEAVKWAETIHDFPNYRREALHLACDCLRKALGAANRTKSTTDYAADIFPMLNRVRAEIKRAA